MTTMTVGFIGLGIMGRGMVRNLLAAGHDVTVWNRTRGKAEELNRTHGAALAGSPKELAAGCEAIVLCVSDTPDVEEVLEGPDGVRAGAASGSLIIDCSTISPSVTRDLAATAWEAEIGYCDAPVSGGSEGAEQGTLSIMVGGSETDVTRARPILDAMSSSVTHVGPVGSGQAVKLVNQVLVVVTMLGVAEAMLFADAQGLDLSRTIEAVKGGAAGSWALSNRAPQMVARDWRPGFTIDLQEKDLRLVLELADELRLPLIATSMVQQLYRALQSTGLGDEGNHALVKALERLAGREIDGG